MVTFQRNDGKIVCGELVMISANGYIVKLLLSDNLVALSYSFLPYLHWSKV